MLVWNEVSFDTVLRGRSSGRRRPFVHLRFCAKLGHVSCWSIDFLCQKEFGLPCVMKRESFSCLFHLLPYPSWVPSNGLVSGLLVPKSGHRQTGLWNKTKVEGIGSCSSYAVMVSWTLSSHDSLACQIFATQGRFAWKPMQILRETCMAYSTCFLLCDFLRNITEILHFPPTYKY